MIRPAFTEIGVFLIPFAVYALFLVATRSGLMLQSSWPVHIIGRLVLGSLLQEECWPVGRRQVVAVQGQLVQRPESA